ncbi:MAG: PIN domain-containing protein [Opitutaceae bacterium]
MPTPAITHFVFVDFENVTEVDLSAISNRPVQVTLLIGKNQKRLDTSFSLQLHRYAGQIVPIEVGASGRNALDLTLAFYLGRALERAPSAHFAIVSKDTDFDAMIEHLVRHKITIARYDTFTALPFLHPHRKPVTPAKPVIAKATPSAKKPVEDRGAKVIARLKNPDSQNRPASQTALLAHLKTALGKQATDANVAELFRRLRDERVLAIDGTGDVIYAATK